MFKKPDLGQKPTFLVEEEGQLHLPTSSRFRRASDALRDNREHALAAVEEYLSLLSTELENLRIIGTTGQFDDAVVQSIDAFLPYRNEAIQIFLNVFLYRDNLESRTILHRFFESLIPYMERPQNLNTSFREWDWDNYRFIIHELFLYVVAAMIRKERFESANFLMNNGYFLAGRSEYGRDVMVSFSIFRQHMKSLLYRNERLKLRRLSLRADFLHNRCVGTGIEFRHLMEADFILFMRNHIDNPDGPWGWWPETLLYAERFSGPFEVFARSRSKSYFERSKVLLGIENKTAIEPLLKSFADAGHRLPSWQGDSFNPLELLGFNELATKP